MKAITLIEYFSFCGLSDFFLFSLLSFASTSAIAFVFAPVSSSQSTMNIRIRKRGKIFRWSPTTSSNECYCFSYIYCDNAIQHTSFDIWTYIQGNASTAIRSPLVWTQPYLGRNKGTETPFDNETHFQINIFESPILLPNKYSRLRRDQ